MHEAGGLLFSPFYVSYILILLVLWLPILLGMTPRPASALNLLLNHRLFLSQLEVAVSSAVFW